MVGSSRPFSPHSPRSPRRRRVVLAGVLATAVLGAAVGMLGVGMAQAQPGAASHGPFHGWDGNSYWEDSALSKFFTQQDNNGNQQQDDHNADGQPDGEEASLSWEETPESGDSDSEDLQNPGLAEEADTVEVDVSVGDEFAADDNVPNQPLNQTSPRSDTPQGAVQQPIPNKQGEGDFQRAQKIAQLSRSQGNDYPLAPKRDYDPEENTLSDYPTTMVQTPPAATTTSQPHAGSDAPAGSPQQVGSQQITVPSSVPTPRLIPHRFVPEQDRFVPEQAAPQLGTPRW